MGMTECQVPPSDKFPISLAKEREDAYLVIYMHMQGYRCGQSVEFSFFNASDCRLRLDLRPKSNTTPRRDESSRKWYIPPAHWYGSPNAVWMVKFETSHYSDTTRFYFSVLADGQTFPGNPVTYFVPHVSGAGCSRDFDAVTYHYVGYDVVHGRAITDSEKMATVAIFNGPTAEFEARTYFAKQLDHEVPSSALKDVEARERAVAAQQEAVNSKEKALEKREQILHAREVALEQREGTLPQGGGTQPSQFKPASDIRPSDYDSTKVSATKAWPGVIKEVFGKEILDDWTGKYHDFMRNWVEERGDDLPSTAYDYLVYAHGVAWPHIVSQHTSDVDFVGVREKHAAVMRILT